MTQRRSAQRVVHTPACEPHAVHSQMVSGGLDNFYGFFFNTLVAFAASFWILFIYNELNGYSITPSHLDRSFRLSLCIQVG